MRRSALLLITAGLLASSVAVPARSRQQRRLADRRPLDMDMDRSRAVSPLSAACHRFIRCRAPRRARLRELPDTGFAPRAPRNVHRSRRPLHCGLPPARAGHDPWQALFYEVQPLPRQAHVVDGSGPPGTRPPDRYALDARRLNQLATRPDAPVTGNVTPAPRYRARREHSAFPSAVTIAPPPCSSCGWPGLNFTSQLSSVVQHLAPTQGAGS
jgi:hypothetical protein